MDKLQQLHDRLQELLNEFKGTPGAAYHLRALEGTLGHLRLTLRKSAAQAPVEAAPAAAAAVTSADAPPAADVQDSSPAAEAPPAAAIADPAPAPAADAQPAAAAPDAAPAPAAVVRKPVAVAVPKAK